MLTVFCSPSPNQPAWAELISCEVPVHGITLVENKLLCLASFVVHYFNFELSVILLADL